MITKKEYGGIIYYPWMDKKEMEIMAVNDIFRYAAMLDRKQKEKNAGLETSTRA